MMCMLSGCSVLSNFSLSYYPSDPYNRPNERVIGSIAFQPDENEKPMGKMNVYKINKGYALMGNIHNDKKTKSRSDFVISKDKDYKWFAGFRLRFEF